MNSYITTTRDAVVTEIEAAMLATTLAPTTEVQACYDIFFNLEDLTGGQILVIPEKIDRDPMTRGGARHKEIFINVAIQFKYGTTGPTAAVLDPYMQLAESTADFFERKTLSNGAVCTKVTHPLIFVDEQLRKFRTFTAVLSLAFTVNSP